MYQNTIYGRPYANTFYYTYKYMFLCCEKRSKSLDLIQRIFATRTWAVMETTSESRFFRVNYYINK